jgi:hypothetical protein
LKYRLVILCACIECVSGIFTEKGCGGTKVISRETGSFPPSFIFRMHEYLTQSFARGTTPEIISFASNITLYEGIF